MRLVELAIHDAAEYCPPPPGAQRHSNPSGVFRKTVAPDAHELHRPAAVHLSTAIVDGVAFIDTRPSARWNVVVMPRQSHRQIGEQATSSCAAVDQTIRFSCQWLGTRPHRSFPR